MLLSEKISSMSRDCSLLAEDINSIIHSRVKSNGDTTVASRKSIEPTIRLRKTSEDMKIAGERDPQDQFVIDKLTDIFGG